MSETPTAVTMVKTHIWHVYAVSRSGYWVVAGSITNMVEARAAARKTGLPLAPWSKAVKNTGLGRYLGAWSNRRAA